MQCCVFSAAHSEPRGFIPTWFLAFINLSSLALKNTGNVLSSLFFFFVCSFSHPGVARIVWQFQNKNVIGV